MNYIINLYDVINISIPLALATVLLVVYMSELVHRYNAHESTKIKFWQKIVEFNEKEMRQNDELKNILLEIKSNLDNR